MSENNAERRTFSRIPFDAQSFLHWQGSEQEVQLIDLSLKGALLKANIENIDEQPCRISIRLSDEDEIQMDLALRHQEGQLMGFECLEIDLDSIAHLKRLVELNLGNSNLLEREWQALISDH